MGCEYLDIDNAISVISLVGLIDAASILTGVPFHESREARALMIRILQAVASYLREMDERGVLRLACMPIEGENHRFAELDLESHSSIKHCLEGRGAPYYVSDPAHLPIPFEELFRLAADAQRIASGGHILNILLAEPMPPPSSLSSTIKRAFSKGIRMVTFSRDLTYCKRCDKIMGGYHNMCPSCSFSGSKIKHYGKLGLYYEELDSWPLNRRAEYLDRYRYIIV